MVVFSGLLFVSNYLSGISRYFRKDNLEFYFNYLCETVMINNGVGLIKHGVNVFFYHIETSQV